MNRFLVATVTAAFVAPLLAAPITPPAWVKPLPIPGGVADAAGKTGFIANDKDAVEAINLETGEVLWTADVRGKPLAVTDNHLAVQVPATGKNNAVRVVVLDTAAKGKQILESEPVVFPDWVATGLVGGKSFTSSGKLYQGDLLLSWQANASYWGGAKPPPRVEQAGASMLTAWRAST